MPTESELDDHEDEAPLRYLLDELRRAIAAALMNRRLPLAVALDTARTEVEAVLMSPSATSTRRAIARTHAEIALEVWRESSSSSEVHV